MKRPCVDFCPVLSQIDDVEKICLEAMKLQNIKLFEKCYINDLKDNEMFEG